MTDREFLYWLQGRLEGETYIRDGALDEIRKKLDEIINRPAIIPQFSMAEMHFVKTTDGPHLYSWDLGGPVQTSTTGE